MSPSKKPFGYPWLEYVMIAGGCCAGVLLVILAVLGAGCQ